MYQLENLKALVNNGISGWTDFHFLVELTVGWGSHIQFPVQEAIPKNDSMRFQTQYRLDQTTGQWPMRRMPSPVVGISRFDIVDLWRRLDRYLDNVIEREFRGFPEQCIRGQNEEVYHDLLNAIHRFHVRGPKVSHSIGVKAGFG